MSDQDIFKNSNDQNNQLKNLLEGIKDSDGRQKYDKVEDALVALQNAQNHITTLEEERKNDRGVIEELKGKDNKVDNLENTLNDLLQKKEPKPAETPPPSVKEEDITELVKRTLSERELEAQKQNNVSSVISKLNEKYGDKAADVVSEKATSLGLTPDKIKALAADSPSTVLALFENVTPKEPRPHTGSVRIDTQSNNEPERPKSEKSLLSGASTKDLVDAFKRSKDYTNQRLKIE
jgi:hypothetical protein